VSAPEQPTRADRAARRAASRRRTTLWAGIAVVAVVALVVVAALAFGGEEPGETATPTPSGSAAPAAPSDLVLLSVTGADDAYLAVAGHGGGRDAAAVTIEPGTTIVVPGQGETVVEDLAALEGDSVRIGVSNAIGAWIPQYLVLDLDGLSTIVDRAGGLRVNLPEAIPLKGDVVGPGETLLTGPQVVAYLARPGADPGLRWRTVVEALLTQVPTITTDDVLDSDDAADAIASWNAAKGAGVETLPTEVVLATVSVLLQPDADLLVQERFGTTAPIRTLVQNGSGEPGVGEDVARLLIPEGFRIVLSQNAEDFDHDVTQVIASDDDSVEAARAAQEALGVGLVEVAQVPSGVAEVTIVVGKDFEA
jgi:hypothetical protein